MESTDLKGTLLTWLFFFAIIGVVIFCGRSYFKLAKKYNKNQWSYALLGVASLFFGVFLGRELEILIRKHNSMDTAPYALSGYLRPIIALFVCYVLYKILQRKWKET